MSLHVDGYPLVSFLKLEILGIFPASVNVQVKTVCHFCTFAGKIRKRYSPKAGRAYIDSSLATCMDLSSNHYQAHLQHVLIFSFEIVFNNFLIILSVFQGTAPNASY